MRASVGFPAQKGSCNSDIIRGNCEELSEDALTGSALGRCDDWGYVTIAPERVRPALNRDVGPVHSRYRRRLDVDVHEPAPGQRAAVTSLVSGHVATSIGSTE